MKKIVFWSVVGVVLILGLLQLPRIRQISCSTQYAACPSYYVDRLNFLLGKSLVFLPKRNSVTLALASYAEVKDIKLGRKLPKTLVVEIQLNRPMGIVNGYLVDEDGKIISVATTSALPKFTVDEQILPGKTLNKNQLNALIALNAAANIFSENIPASLSGQILRFAIGQTEVILDVNSLPKSFTSSLQLIFTRSKIDGNAPKTVDMRFNNPIIVY
jgi:hypothetical protein